MKITLLFIGLLSLYIGNVASFNINKYLLTLVLLVFSSCTIGIMIRLRGIIDQQFIIISNINEKLAMLEMGTLHGIRKIRTSTYLSVIVVMLSLFAILLTLLKP